MEFFRVGEVAKIFRMRKSVVYELIRSGKLKAIQLSQRGIRISRKAIDDFVREQENQGGEAKKYVSTPRKG